MIKYLFLLISMSSGLYPIPSGMAVAHAPSAESALAATENTALRASETAETKTVWVTAYSSTPEETDSTPFITASGITVRDGIVATNMLPFGTRIQIPALFGEKVFIVEDRMHVRKEGFVDVWMSTKQAAQRFGIAKTDIVILE